MRLGKSSVYLPIIFFSLTLCLAISCGDEYSRRARKEFDELGETFEKDFQAFIAVHFESTDRYRNVEWEILCRTDSAAYRDDTQAFDGWMDSLRVDLLEVFGPEVQDSSWCSPAHYDSVWVLKTEIIEIGGRKEKLGYIEAWAFCEKRQCVTGFEFFFIFDGGWIFLYSKMQDCTALFQEYKESGRLMGLD